MIATDEPTIGDEHVPASESSIARRPGILLAISDVRACSTLAAFLHRQGFNVWTAFSGVEAISAYLERTGSVDLLLVDADLTDPPGTSFLRRFKTYFPGVPCVLRVRNPETAGAELRAAGAIVVSAGLSPEALADCLWELAAFEFLVEA
jgi:CheY-like chemotaxis protein